MPFLIPDTQFSLIFSADYEPGTGYSLQTEKNSCFQGIYSLVVETELNGWSLDTEISRLK